MNMTPKEIVAYLDEYIVGQKDAKKSIAIALRNRYRRLKLDKSMQEEVTPKNILMIGPTGVGKTEIARRMSKLLNLPFVKVEASKYTEVGFVGRDVESMVRDLVYTALNIVKEEHKAKIEHDIESYVVDKIARKLLPELPKGATPEKLESYEISLTKMKEKVASGACDHLKIELDMTHKKSFDGGDGNLPVEVIKIQESFSKLLGSINDNQVKKEMTVAEAREYIKAEAGDKLLDMEAVKAEAIKRAADGGIIFIDEIDKIAVSSKSSGRNDPSKEGVQRDLLPIVEGSNVSTKYGTVATDHILFIAAGAFHLAKPSDLIPELQGRFPLRVELNSLDEEALYKILTSTKNSILKQYAQLLDVEGVELVFDDEAVKEIAKVSQKANEKTEDIGARRLHTVIEKVMEDISFDADERSGERVVVTAELVKEKLLSIIENEDHARYIL
jgi:ATP-dependent HslUV protease ATP-binding subunit HslU